MTQDVPSFRADRYPAPERDDSKIRAFREDVDEAPRGPADRSWT